MTPSTEAIQLDATSKPSPPNPSVTKVHATPAKPSSTSSEDDFGKGVIFYLNENDRVVGILLWNVFNRISIARKIIAQDTNYEDLNEVAKLFDLFDIHDEEAKQ